MKIFMIGQKGLPAIFGGVERHVHELGMRLVKVGHTVTAYARKWYSPKMPSEVNGIKIKYCPTIHTKHLDTIVHTFLATIQAIKSKPDVIHYHGVGPSLLSWIPRIFAPQIKIITTFHSIDRKHQKWGLFARAILKLGEWSACKFAHQTIAVSKTIAQYCRDVYDIEAIFIPNGVPLYQKNSETNLLAKWNLEPQKYLLMLSRLIPHKKAHLLIESFKQLKTINPEITKDLKLVIVGDGYYTEKYVEYLHTIAKNEEAIIFTGFQTDETLAQLLSHAKLMIHPSSSEGTPLTVLEGMSYQLPVLLSNIPEHQELVSDNDFLFGNGDSSELIKKLVKILKMTEEELKTAGKENYAMVEKNYSWDQITESINNLYLEPLPKEYKHLAEIRE